MSVSLEYTDDSFGTEICLSRILSARLCSAFRQVTDILRFSQATRDNVLTNGDWRFRIDSLTTVKMWLVELGIISIDL